MRNVGAIVLAAGGSIRLGQPKQLLRAGGESLVRRPVNAAIGAGCARVVIVAGALRDEIDAELHGLAVDVVTNAEWQRGVGSSIRAGLDHMLPTTPRLHAVVLLACDQPFVDASVVRRLISAWTDSSKPIVASRYADAVGVPSLFDRSCFHALRALPDQSGAKPLIESRLADAAFISFEAGAIDIDTPSDVAAFLNYCEQRASLRSGGSGLI
jgi:molybdenum cofactor cytidylyltransferase